MSNLLALLPPAAGCSRLVLDGGLATELERTYAYDLSSTSLWSAALLKDPSTSCDCIRNVNLNFLRAGADIIATSSYQATVEGFVASGCTEAEGEELLCRSVHLACEARDAYLSSSSSPEGLPRRVRRQQPPYVAISLGCYGAFLADGSEFTGKYPAQATIEDFLLEFHRKRLEVYRRGGALDMADVLAFETIPNAVEARAIARLMRDEASRGLTMPFWVSFSARKEGHGSRCSSGEAVSECFGPFIEGGVVPGLVALGFNCSDPQLFPSLLRTAAECLLAAGAAAYITLAAYPNLGEEWDPIVKAWKNNSGLRSENFGKTVAGWVRDMESTSAGGGVVTVGLVGGCCRTTPEMITNLKACLEQMTSSSSSAANDQ